MNSFTAALCSSINGVPLARKRTFGMHVNEKSKKPKTNCPPRKTDWTDADKQPVKISRRRTTYFPTMQSDLESGMMGLVDLGKSTREDNWKLLCDEDAQSLRMIIANRADRSFEDPLAASIVFPSAAQAASESDAPARSVDDFFRGPSTLLSVDATASQDDDDSSDDISEFVLDEEEEAECRDEEEQDAASNVNVVQTRGVQLDFETLADFGDGGFPEPEAELVGVPPPTPAPAPEAPPAPAPEADLIDVPVPGAPAQAPVVAAAPPVTLADMPEAAPLPAAPGAALARRYDITNAVGVVKFLRKEHESPDALHPIESDRVHKHRLLMQEVLQRSGVARVPRLKAQVPREKAKRERPGLLVLGALFSDGKANKKAPSEQRQALEGGDERRYTLADVLASPECANALMCGWTLLPMDVLTSLIKAKGDDTVAKLSFAEMAAHPAALRMRHSAVHCALSFAAADNELWSRQYDYVIGNTSSARRAPLSFASADELARSLCVDADYWIGSVQHN